MKSVRCWSLAALICQGCAVQVGSGAADGQAETAGGADTTPSAEAESGSLDATWDAALTVSTNLRNGAAYASSSQLSVAWKAVAGVHHYRLSVSESVGGEVLSLDVDAAATATTLARLKSATAYTVTLEACSDDACKTAAAGGSATGQTETEHWQIQGSDDSIANATRIVDGGNTMVWAIRYGADAPAEVAGRLQLYFNPQDPSGKGVRIAVSPVVDGSLGTVSGFELVSPTSQLTSPKEATELVSHLNTVQPVPLAFGGLSLTRLFLEANDAFQKTRLLAIDSADGLLGRDFNAGDGVTCATAADYQGPCKPTVILGLEGDAEKPNPYVLAVRQSKLGYPTQDDWRWDGAAGTFMVVTMNLAPTCPTSSRTQGYAQWTGDTWELQYGTDGCPLRFSNMQAPSPMHVEGARYKLYYGDPTAATVAFPRPGTPGGFPVLGPKRVIYAHGARTGDPAQVEFADWEDPAGARELQFLWPSGAPVEAKIEDYLDDFVFLTPTGDLDLQVMYTAMTDGSFPPVLGMAVLVNP
jgi:hypothetical protein